MPLGLGEVLIQQSWEKVLAIRSATRVSVNAHMDVFTSVKNVQTPKFSVWSPLATNYIQNSRSGCKYMSSSWALVFHFKISHLYSVMSSAWGRPGLPRPGIISRTTRLGSFVRRNVPEHNCQTPSAHRRWMTRSQSSHKRTKQQLH